MSSITEIEIRGRLSQSACLLAWQQLMLEHSIDESLESG